MPQQELKDLSSGLALGLRPFERMEIRSEHLTELQNLRPRDWGLEAIRLVSNGSAPWPAVNWPFPQLVSGEARSFLFSAVTVEEIDESDWSRTVLTTFDQNSASQTKAIPTGGPWHFADLKTAWFAGNGSCVLFDPGWEKYEGQSEKVFVQDTVTIQTLCTHRGRVVFGGFNSADVWTNLSSILAGWDTAETDVTTPTDDVGQNYVMWSSIGGGDFPLWLFYPVGTGYSYDLAPTAARLLDRVRENTFGWSPMPFQGTVRKVAPLGQHVIIYGDDGIAAPNTHIFLALRRV